MEIGYLLAHLFEKFPEWPIKNQIRYFLAFNKFIPSFISNVSPLKGYELYHHVKKGYTVVDAGAFTGDYTIFAARRVGENGKVLAFEPDFKNRKILEKNIAYEGLSNILVIPKGLWSRNGVLSMNDSQGLRSSFGDGKGTKVEVVKLDDELKKLGVKKVDFIKMDIEGAETEAIKGCVKTLKKNSAFLAIASYHIVNEQPAYIFLEKFLSKIGYYVKSDFPKHMTTYGWKTKRLKK